jgi:hypothetical protein
LEHNLIIQYKKGSDYLSRLQGMPDQILDFDPSNRPPGAAKEGLPSQNPAGGNQSMQSSTNGS